MTSDSQKDQLELCLVMRHVWPVLAGAAERFRRYAPGLRERGVSMTAVARQADAGMALDETAPGNMRVLRVPAAGDVPEWDRRLFERLMEHTAAHPGQQRILQTNLANNHTRPLIQQLRRQGMPAVWLGSMVEDISAGLPWWRQLRERLRLRWMLGAFDAFTVGSTVMSEWLRHAWIPAGRIQIIGNGVDQVRFCPLQSVAEKTALRERWDLPQDGVITLLVGTITARKGVHLLLEAWENQLAAHPRAHLVLAGAFDRPTVVHEAQQRELASYQQGIHAQLARLAATGRVRHLGEVADIHLLMRACDILVLPSDREGVGNVVLEAMSSGLACVLTPYMGLPREELGTEGETWLLSERTATALAETLAALINDEARRQRIGSAALKHALAHYGLDKTLDAFAALFHRLSR